VKTEIDTRQVEAAMQSLKRWAEGQDDPFVRFQANPRLDEHFDPQSNELVFSSPWITYRLVSVDAESTEIARQYRRFCDWCARLNTLLIPGSRLPFARLLVNEALERREEFPKDVHLTLTPRKGFPPSRITMRSEHQLIRRLAESDKRRVAQTDVFCEMFRPLSFGEYQENLRN
jgi:hypothetical protein